MHEALLYETLPENRVRCQLCGHRCVITSGKYGVCQVRQNRGGILYTHVYGRTISQQVDPVEKKPLYHFLPGSRAYSIATPGCNFHCRWCQNWKIAQMPRERNTILGHKATPEEIVASAQRAQSRSIAYTYTEPTIFFEYAYDTAKLAHEAGLANIFVTNGYMTSEMLDMLHPYLDAANVDLKSFRKETYHRLIEASMKTVLENLILLKKLGIWLEVTTLIIPGMNDDPEEIKEIAQFIALELGEDTPWHISRFFPAYRMANKPPTPVETLWDARDIGLAAGLQYIYLGNTPGASNTGCPYCGRLLIRRLGYTITANRIEQARCYNCGEEIAGVWAGVLEK